MEYSQKHINRLGSVLLETAAVLQSSGASTSRIHMTLNRVASTYNCDIDVMFTLKTLVLTVSHVDHEYAFTGAKQIPPIGVHFSKVTAISQMSWRIKKNVPIESDILLELESIANTPHHPRWLVVIAVGLAGAGFCGITGGPIIAMLVAFVATCLGLITRQELHKRGFNAYICVFVASFVACIITGGVLKLYPDQGFQAAFATSVLFLIPGVPLINSFSDLLAGYTLNGFARFVVGLFTVFMIALGLILALTLYHI